MKATRPSSRRRRRRPLVILLLGLAVVGPATTARTEGSYPQLAQARELLEAGLLARDMQRVDQFTVLQTVGREAGWLAAASALARTTPDSAPHIILLPEVPFKKRDFLKRVKQCVQQSGYCVIVVSEGARYANGAFLADAGTTDAFGHKQLGGVAPTIAAMVKDNLGYKYHWAVADYLQRSARHIASATDVEQAYAVGAAAVDMALAGKNAVMATIERGKGKRYRWHVGDPVHYDKEIIAEMEHGGDNRQPADYRSAAFFFESGP